MKKFVNSTELFTYRRVFVPAAVPDVPQRKRVNAQRAGQQQQQRGHRAWFLFIYLFKKTTRAQLEPEQHLSRALSPEQHPTRTRSRTRWLLDGRESETERERKKYGKKARARALQLVQCTSRAAAGFIPSDSFVLFFFKLHPCFFSLSLRPEGQVHECSRDLVWPVLRVRVRVRASQRTRGAGFHQLQHNWCS